MLRLRLHCLAGQWKNTEKVGGADMRYNISDRVYLGLKQLAKKHGIKKIILFGSRARGNFYEEIIRDGIIIYEKN